MQILVPKTSIVYRGNSIPLFFLAGPIRGGGDWQHIMCLELAKRIPECVIVCPAPWDNTHPLASDFILENEAGAEEFRRQLDWERHYLEAAGNEAWFGCIVFWLPCESKTQPHGGPEPYAMDTRGELGEWRWRMNSECARVVVGGEAGFHGLSQIERNFKAALSGEFTLYNTLEQTADAAVKMLKQGW